MGNMNPQDPPKLHGGEGNERGVARREKDISMFTLLHFSEETIKSSTLSDFQDSHEGMETQVAYLTFIFS